jgi:hypothetical protein
MVREPTVIRKGVVNLLSIGIDPAAREPQYALWRPAKLSPTVLRIHALTHSRLGAPHERTL